MVLLQRGRPGQLRRAFPILMYHRIGDPPPGWRWPGLYVTRDDLAAQLQELARRGYAAVTQRDLWGGWNATRVLPAKPFVASFDDGHASVWREAFPLLSARGWPAVLNLDMSMLDSDTGLSSEMVSDLVHAGWELAAHSRTHPDLTELDVASLEGEVHAPRIELAEQFGVPVDFFCYPSGRVSPEVVRSVVRAGYTGATTTVPGLAGPEQPYAMPRVRVSRGDSGRRLARRLEQLHKQHKTRSVRDGHLIAAAQAVLAADPAVSEWRSIHQLDARLVAAVVMSEDRHFWRHHGIDWSAAWAAAKANLRGWQVRFGASTLPMQVVRMLHRWSKRSYTRKLRESLLAWWLIARYERETVLEVYLNIVPFAAGTRGVVAGAARLLKRDPVELSLFDATLLAAALTDPELPPGSTPAFIDWLRVKQRRVVDDLVEAGNADAAEAAAAAAQIESTWGSTSTQAASSQ